MKKRKIGFFALLICLLLSLPVSAAETKRGAGRKPQMASPIIIRMEKLQKVLSESRTRPAISIREESW